MTQFINAKEDLVRDAIDGVIACSGGALKRLDGYPHIKVVHRANWDSTKVALISGGGSGHEPAHAGFVGPGMLTAAVCGDVFASPSVDAVLAGILAVTGDAGCLLIVKNYTGDRLNFGLAAERARALGLKVEMVVVADDVALPDLPQPRGVAGTLFVHKVAGAMAEAGVSLDQVAIAARSIIEKTVSIGISLDTCTVPGSAKEERIPSGHAELGLGIHGEPGVEQVAFNSAQEAMTMVLDKLRPHIKDGPCVALLNNLGATTALEMSVLANTLAQSGIATHVVGPAAMMTALDMHGFSVSVMPMTTEETSALETQVNLAAWPGLKSIAPIEVSALSKDLSPVTFNASADDNHRAVLEHAADVLMGAEKALNELDAKSGDGDTGSTLATAAKALKGSLDKLPLADITQLLPAIGNELGQTMGGSSGVIMAIFFNAAGDASKKGADLTDSLKEGLARVSEVGGASVGDRTMIDALAPALDALASGVAPAASAAREGAQSTASILQAKAGRAAYVPAENLDGYNDPGAEAVALIFEGLSEKLKS